MVAQAIVHALGFNILVPHMDNAWAEECRDWINGLGHGLHAFVIDKSVCPSAIANQYIPEFRYLMVGTNCTSNAEPTPTVTGIRHWVAVYDTSGGILNVWKPSNEHIQLDADHSNLMNTVVVWRDGWPAPAPPAPPGPVPPLGEDDSMGASFVLPDNSQQARLWIDGNKHIQECWYVAANRSWNGPADLTASNKLVPAAGGLSACAAPDGTQLVFWTGTDGHQHEIWYAGGKWNGPLTIPKT